MADISQESGLYKHEIKNATDLIPYANNSRTHDEIQVKQIAASIKEWGFTNPLLIDETNSVIAGHGRLLAAQKLGIEQIPCIILDGLTDAQKKAYVIADNRLALNAGWDDELLQIEIESLNDDNVNLDLLGFTDDEIGVLLGLTEEVGFPELADGEKEPFQQKTFTLHDEQAAIVDDAITLARVAVGVDTGLNENSNGNGLALICEQWLGAQNGES